MPSLLETVSAATETFGWDIPEELNFELPSLSLLSTLGNHGDADLSEEEEDRSKSLSMCALGDLHTYYVY